MKHLTFKIAATALAVGLCAASLSQARAEAVNVAAGTGVQVSDPSGSGRAVGVLFAGGSSDLAFSTGGYDGQDTSTLGGMVSVLEAASLKLGGLGGAAAAETRANPGDPTTLTNAAVSGMRVAGITADDATGQLLSIGTTGGFSLTGAFKPGISLGGQARVENLRFDLIKRQIVADLSGTRAATNVFPAQNYNLPGTALWTFAAVTGLQALLPSAWLAADPMAALTADGYSVTRIPATATEPPGFEATGAYTFSGLTITSEGYAFLVNALGLIQNGKTALAGVGDQGTMTATLSFAQPVPEPQTCALMGLGFCLMAAAVRRHKPRAA